MARYVQPATWCSCATDGAMMAAAFDEDALEFTGPAVPLFEGVMTKSFARPTWPSPGPAPSRTCPAWRRPAVGSAEVVVCQPERGTAPLDPPLTYNPTGSRALSLSPDAAAWALDVLGQPRPDLWVKQHSRTARLPLSFDTRQVGRPRWTPHGSALIYVASRDSSPSSVWRRRRTAAPPRSRSARYPVGRYR
jgi:hypothetical protein